MAEGEIKKGRVQKILFFDEQGEPLGETPSLQIPDDPFEGQMERAKLQSPPYSMEQLVFLSETHPVHGSALEQKAIDIIGQGWTWEAIGDNPDESKKKALDKWFRGLSKGELTIDDTLGIYVEDYVKTAQGFLEVARDAQGNAAQVYQVPSHTCRFHRDGIRIAQIRGERMVWFKRWGSPETKHVNRDTGTLSDKVPPHKIANELLVLQRPTSRSTWYGLPRYVTCIGWITLALAVRDDNLLFFANRREPRWAIVLSNLEDNDDIEEDLRQAFAVDLKQPHRNILIPITGQGKIDFQKLSNDRMDGSFEKLGARADAHILAAHRMPPDRLGLVRVGVLGGNVAIDSSKVYKDAVIAPEQRMLAARVNRFIEVEFLNQQEGSQEDEGNGWRWIPNELNIDTETEDIKNAALAWTSGMIMLKEARRRIGEDPDPKRDEPEEAEPEPQVRHRASCDENCEAGGACAFCGMAEGQMEIEEPPAEKEPEVPLADKFYWEVTQKTPTDDPNQTTILPTPESDRDRAEDALTIDRPSDLDPDNDEEDHLGKAVWGEE